jgi:hypothetical protein
MGGFDYRVRTVYEAEDRHSGIIDKIAGKAKVAAGALSVMGGAARGLGGLMDSAAGAMLRLGGAAVGLVGLGGAGLAIKGISTGLVGVNAKLEDSQIGFATIFNMLGNTGMTNGLVLGKSLMADIRKDAAALPGEFGDFVSMAQTLTAPLLNAGKGVQDIREMTSQTVVAAAAMGVQFDQAAREMAMLLEGHAGGHNVLGMRLGINTHTQVNGKEFNKATAAERFDFLQKAMAKSSDSLDSFKHSWSGLTSTMVDNIKMLLGRTTAPLFERIKGSLEGINKVLDSGKATHFADAVGGMLTTGYDKLTGAVDYVVDHWGVIKSYAHEAAETLERVWTRIEPIAKRVATALIEHPGATLGTMAGARVGLGAAGALAPMAGSALTSMLSKGGKEVGKGIAETAATTAPAMGGLFGKGGGALGEQISLNPLLAGTAEGTIGGALPAASAEASVGLLAVAGPAMALGLVLAALVGVFDVLTPNTEHTALLFHQLQEWGQGMWREIKENFGAALTETTQFLKDMWTIGKPLVDLLGIALLGAIDAAIYAFRLVTAPMRLLAGAIAKVLKMIPGYGDGNEGEGDKNTIGDVLKSKKLREVKAVDTSALDAELAAMDSLEKGKKVHGAGKTNITNNVYMTVMSESDPERFAVNVATHLDKLMKAPRRAIGVASYLQH